MSALPHVVVVLPVLAFVACAANPGLETLTPDQLQRLSKLQIFEGEPAQQYHMIDAVEGLSCHRNAYATPHVSREEAIEGVRINAVLVSADAVVNLRCGGSNGQFDWKNNCFESIVCVGTAVRLQQ